MTQSQSRSGRAPARAYFTAIAKALLRKSANGYLLLEQTTRTKIGLDATVAVSLFRPRAADCPGWFPVELKFFSPQGDGEPPA